MTRLLSRLLRPRRASHLQVTVYTRAQCCCCHKAIDLLKDYQRRHGFRIEEVDIDADPELRQQYDTTVPVVAIDGKVRFKGVVKPVLLERLLLAGTLGQDEPDRES
jgi:glutaredoxin